jgi:small multidrug resistance family-3 protein
MVCGGGSRRHRAPRAFWASARLDRSAWWLLSGFASLMLFALTRTRADSAMAGRAFA